MKILILENFFNNNKFQGKIKRFYKNLLLDKLVRYYKAHYKNVNFKMISCAFNDFYNKDDINVELLSEYRLRIDRIQFLNIKQKITKITKTNLKILFKYYFNNKRFHYKGLLIPKIIDFLYMKGFTTFCGEYEILKIILKKEEFDKVILFNFNPNFLNLLFSMHKDIKNRIGVYRNPVLDKKKNLLARFFSKYFFLLIIISIKNYLLNSRVNLSNFYENHKIERNKEKILFLANTTNQFHSLKSIYKEFKNNNSYNSLIYSNKNFINPFKLTSLMKFIIRINSLLKSENNNIQFKSKSLIFNKVLELLHNSKEFFFYLLTIFCSVDHLDRLIQKYKPSMVILADDQRLYGKLTTSYCKKNEITTIYIPHAAIPYNPLSITKRDFDYAFVSGKEDKKYLIEKGFREENIFITGRPRYEKFYNKSIKRLDYVKDMFDGRKYEFVNNKFSILFTTNPVDFKTNRKLIINVLEVLDELDLIDNLILKLHPREEGLFHKSLTQKLGVNPIIVRDVDILALIKSGDLLISRISTTLLEAMILETPIIILNFINTDLRFYDTLLFMKEDSLLKANSKKELDNIFRKILEKKFDLEEYSKQLKKISKKYSPKEKTSPTEKSLMIIKKIIEGKKN